MKPSHVLDCHADLLTRMESVPGFLEYLGRAISLGADDSPEAAALKVLTDRTNSPLINAARTAYTYQVTEDMSLLVQHAAEQLDDTDTFTRHEAPTGSGLVLFERPLPVADVRGQMMLAHWCLWGPVMTTSGPAMGMLFLNDDHLGADEVGREVRDGSPEFYSRVVNRWNYIGYSAAFEEQRLGPPLVQADERITARLLAEGVTAHSGTNVLRYIKALWMLLNQTITITKDEEADRATRRRMGRMKLPQRVTVIALRRSEGGHRPEGESQVEWAHRWVVRGHWAWRHCSADHPNAQPYKGGWGSRVWISPYIKNAHRIDLPFAQSEKVYRLER